ncbi:hypothetical protein B0H17DRAFT_1201357 [Mycena rosella]|uniref:Uncharacterized protein n=1 Tax=Mycena rosella TaxID=1033263 RepID=A0AAD7DGA3_MYCRO|nr:hypothetical protein B0H17DRAFT_1201357 [Mycena rosella]
MRFYTVVGTIVVAKHPLNSAAAIESQMELAGIKQSSQWKNVRRRLRSVMENTSDTLRFQHPTFREFLISKACPAEFRINANTWKKILTPSALGLLQGLSNVSPPPAKELEKIAQDSIDFLTDFKVPILQSKPHIYLSVLPWTTPSSVVYKNYKPIFPNTASIRVKNTATQHMERIAVVFSPEGYIVCTSGSTPAAITFWMPKAMPVPLGG